MKYFEIKNHIHITFIQSTFIIVLLLITINLLLCFIYKANFIISRYEYRKKIQHMMSSILWDFRHLLGVLENILSRIFTLLLIKKRANKQKRKPYHILPVFRHKGAYIFKRFYSLEKMKWMKAKPEAKETGCHRSKRRKVKAVGVGGQ